ncbi:AEC family transporter [Azohydromonas caseinilytica]|uniref:AEC family transporter n=1 Tax=Azohydromonas caseinilytica TaxID=2728836 RepID=A0A848FBU5_9BURK|nr:AEC family transporter [Azohydromonas caseinilytica]NML16205.1 AEC family transporter [Azohydromonas caseinilytica]
MTLLDGLSLYLRIAALLLPVVACASVGSYWAWKKKPFPGEFISVLAANFATPALVFHTLLTTPLGGQALLQAGTATVLGFLIAAALAALALRLLKLPVLGLLPAAVLPNSGNLGLPLSQLAFGDEGLAIAVAAFAITSMLQHTVGVWVLSRSSTQRTRFPRGVVFAVAAAGLLRWSGWSLPAPVLESARLVGSLTVPLMLLSLGYALVTVSHGGLRQGAWLGSIRLVVGTLSGLLVGVLLGLPPLVAGVMLLQLAMPVAVASYLYAERLTPHGEVAAGGVLVSTLALLVLSPGLLWLAGAVKG